MKNFEIKEYDDHTVISIFGIRFKNRKGTITDKHYYKSFLFGLIKIDFIYDERIVKYYFFNTLFMLKGFYVGYSIYKIFNLFTFKTTSTTESFLYPILIRILQDKLGEKNINAISIFNRSGEAFLSMHHFEEYFKNNNITNPVFISPYGHFKSITELFYPNVRFIKIPIVFAELSPLINNKTFYEYADTKLYIPLPRKHFAEFEKNLRDGNIITFYEALLKTMKLNKMNSKNLILPKYSEETIKSAETKMKMLNLGKKFAFVTSKARSNGSMTQYFWDKLSLLLYDAGYDVFYNDIPSDKFNSYQKTSFLTLGEARYVAEKADVIIGVRSGLMDIITNKHSKIFCIYKPFFDRGLNLPSLSATIVKNSFSLKQLPSADSSNIYEYDGDNITEDEILADIITKIGK